VGSLAGAAHLRNDNLGVQREAQWEQKSHVEQKGKSFFDFDFQYEYKLWIFCLFNSQICRYYYYTFSTHTIAIYKMNLGAPKSAGAINSAGTVHGAKNSPAFSQALAPLNAKLNMLLGKNK